ncbi:MAG: cysteine hydrolase, partial [Solirubrobacterales bacterium]|nr:cysteine hydrolase [Solirubrobacterales bacterium]
MSEPALDPFSGQMVTQPGAVRSLRPQTTALVIVDMLNDFCETGGAMVLPGAERLYEPIRRLAAAVRDHGGKVVWACDRHESLADAEFRKRQPHCLAGSWGSQVVEALPREADDRELVKRRFSAFFGTDLQSWLAGHGLNQLIACGIVTNICVRSTVHDAFFRDLDVYVPHD